MEEVTMAMKDKSEVEELKGKGEKESARKPAGSKKGGAKKPKEGEKLPYSGTHGYTEEEVNEIVKEQRRKRK